VVTDTRHSLQLNLYSVLSKMAEEVSTVSSYRELRNTDQIGRITSRTGRRGLPPRPASPDRAGHGDNER
jgi:hypothetical protein